MNIAERRLRDYPKYDKEIKYRKWDLEHSEPDINAGIKAQYKNTNPQEVLILSWEKDPYIQNRLFWKKCVEETLAELDNEQRTYVTEYYFDNVYDYRGLARKYYTNKNVIWRACNRACVILEQKLGETL